MNATTRPLRRLVDLFGARPEPERSDGWHWRLVAAGAVLFALGVPRAAGWGSWGAVSPGDPYAWLVQLCVGMSSASWGASGLLLRRGREALSMWFSVLRALLFFPMTASLFLALNEWFGLPWAVGMAVAACAIFYVIRSRRSRQGNERA